MKVIDSGGLADIQLTILLAERSALHAARSCEDEAADRRFTAERQKAEAEMVKMQKTLESINTDLFSNLFSGLLGVIGGFAAGLAAPALGPIVGVLPSAQAFTGAVLSLANGVAGGALAGVQSMGITKAVVAPYVAHLSNQAADAELRAAELETEVALLERAGSLAAADAERARSVVRDARAAIGELRRFLQEETDALVDGKTSGVVLGGGTAGSRELREAFVALRAQREGAIRDAEDAGLRATELRLASLALKREAIEERKDQATLKAWLGIADLAVKIASSVATLGGMEVLQAGVQVASGGQGIISGLLVDGSDARRLDRDAERIVLDAERAEALADEALAERDALERGGVALLAVSREVGAKVESGGSAGISSAGAASIARVLAQYELEAQRGARADRNEAREAKVELGVAAIQKRRAADAKEDAADALHGIVSIVSGVLSAAGGAAVLGQSAGLLEGLGDNVKRFQDLTKVTGSVSGTIDGAARAFVFDPAARGLRRDGEEVDLAGKRAADREEDAKEAVGEAKDRRQRALDLAVAAGKGRTLA